MPFSPNRQQPVDLGKYDNSWYNPGRSLPVRLAWFCIGSPVLRCEVLPSSAIRRLILRWFGAKVGRNVVIKPGVQIKYPWFLEIGENTWIGENAWLDNLTLLRIGSNVCISQGAYLCTGNHDWTDPAFGLIVKTINVADAAWIGAKALVCPGVEVGEGAVAAAGSVVVSNLDPYTVYSGNPAVPRKKRIIVERG